MPARAHINPVMLRWARGRVGFDLQAAAKAAHVKPEQLERWELGEDHPTLSRTIRQMLGLQPEKLCALAGRVQTV